MVQKSANDNPETRDWMVILQADEPLKGREELFRDIGKTPDALPRKAGA